ncbi:MAG: YraN family protein [Candidatus Endonucleobacter sp. (ex Gigantidas childressi)]|nr:YraN family protein [Candidatus Endonucleobacter sp. (ex Gigantidas childressi)]
MPWTLRKINHQGEKAEKSALQYLKKQGLKFLSKNFACTYGELDLIMLDSDTLTFIEVRFRSKSRFGSPAESITQSKMKKIRMAANIFLQHNSQHKRRFCRFDAVTITHDDDSNQNRLQWTKGAF